METNKTVRDLLIDLAEKEDNDLAKILAFYYPKLNIGDKKALFEALFYYYKIPTSYDFTEIKTEIKAESVSDKYSNKDFRIKSFEISNIRGIPDRVNNIPFGMNFFLNDKYNNAVVLANNGVGKSSIFAGLEMVYTQEIGEKRLRTLSRKLEKKDYSEYLKRFPDNKSAECIVQTNEGEFSLNNFMFDRKDLRLLNPTNHFISDYDVYNNGQIDYAGKHDNSNSFHSLIANSLGLSDFINLESILHELKAYRRSTERNNYNRLTKEYADIENNIVKWESEKADKVKELTSLKEKTNESSQKSKSKTPQETARELLAKSLTYTLIKDSYSDKFSDFYNSYTAYQSMEQSASEKKIIKKDFLELGLELIHDESNCPFCLDSKKNLEDIKENVMIRHEKLRSNLSQNEKLRDCFRRFVECLNTFARESIEFRNFIAKESVEILSIQSLSELREKENSFNISLSNIFLFDDDELIDFIAKLNETLRPNDIDFKKLFDLINNNHDLFFTIVPKKIVEVNNLISFRQEILNNLSKVEETTEIISTEKVIILIEEELKKIEMAIIDSKKRLDTLNPQIDSAKKDAELVDKIKNDVTVFLPLYSRLINELVNTAFAPIKDSVENILGAYLKEESKKNIQFKIGRNEYKVQIDDEEVINYNIVAKLEFINEETGEIQEITPDKFFNSFRYKLFCLMVSLSLALSTRKKYKINLPLVIDDIFYSSDFVNKHTFADFIIKIIELFTNYTPDMPLQFILLTHDDLIFKCAIDGLSHFDSQMQNENRMKILNKTLIGRYFALDDKDEKPSTIIETNKLYWNLLYQLPQNIINRKYSQAYEHKNEL